MLHILNGGKCLKISLMQNSKFIYIVQCHSDTVVGTGLSVCPTLVSQSPPTVKRRADLVNWQLLIAYRSECNHECQLGAVPPYT